jgi:hypothetical protein
MKTNLHVRNSLVTTQNNPDIPSGYKLFPPTIGPPEFKQPTLVSMRKKKQTG